LIVCPGSTRKGNSLDFIIHGSALSIEDASILDDSDESDHHLLVSKLKIACPVRSNKMLRIPNRKLADSFTLNSLTEASEAFGFLKGVENRMRSVDLDIMRNVKRKPFKRELLLRLLAITEEDSDLRLVIKNFWREKAEDNEALRFSDKSREAFEFMKKVFKYHEYNRRDGSIISKVIDEEGKLIVEEDEVNRRVISALWSVQLNEPVYSKPEPFPRLDEPSEEEMEDMLRQLSTNKAIAFDGVTDLIFNKSWRYQVKCKLQNLWNVLARNHNIQQLHFDQRLLPLNKVHPKVPKPQECRPIVVSSPIIKLLEVRVKRKLEKYITEKLIHSQTSFVPHSGITINQMRLLDRVG